MLRVLMPNGTLVAVEKVVPATERRIWFNGREMRLCERATEIDYANALGFFLETQVRDNFGMATQDVAFLGNLPNDLVNGVLESLVREGYVNLSYLHLQKRQPLTSSYLFDNGASGAYMIQGYEAMCCCADALGNPFGTIPAANNAEDAGEEDCADE